MAHLVLVSFLFYGPSTHLRSFRARSVTLTTLILGKTVYQYLVHILLPVTDNCSSWISGRGRENGRRTFFMTKSPQQKVPDMGIKLRVACMPSGHASDQLPGPVAHLVNPYVTLNQYPKFDNWASKSLHGKTDKMTVRPAKTQISLIRVFAVHSVGC